MTDRMQQEFTKKVHQELRRRIAFDVRQMESDAIAIVIDELAPRVEMMGPQAGLADCILLSVARDELRVRRGGAHLHMVKADDVAEAKKKMRALVLAYLKDRAGWVWAWFKAKLWMK